MKRITFLLLTCVMLFGLAGCGKASVSKDGQVWQVDADFVGLWQQLEGENEKADSSVPDFPNAKLLALYDLRFMQKAEEVQGTAAQDGVTLNVERVVNGIATVTIDNQSDCEFEYSAYYALEKEIDGTWYTLPADLGFNDIGYLLPAGGQDTFACDLTYYGTLEPGSYRLVKDGLYAEFTLDETGVHDPLPSDVVMTVTYVTAESAVVTLANNGEDTGYIWDFILERLEDGQWEKVPFSEDYGICGTQDPLPSGETETLTLDLAYLFGKLPAGHYRLRMESEGWSAEFDLN